MAQREEMEQELRELQEERTSLTGLQKHPGYVVLMQLAAEAQELREKDVFLNPVRAFDEIFEQEYKKGLIAGIALFSTLVEGRIVDLTTEIEAKLEEAKEIEDERSSESDAE